MSKQGAERAVVISALVVFGIYFYRLATEGSGKTKQSTGGVGQLIGVGTPANIGRFITGWGFAFLVLSIITEASPALGGSLAILVGVSDFLANGQDLANQVSKGLGATTTGATTVTATGSSTATGPSAPASTGRSLGVAAGQAAATQTLAHTISGLTL